MRTAALRLVRIALLLAVVPLALRPGAARAGAPDAALTAAEALEYGEHLLRSNDPDGALEWFRLAELLAPRTGGVDLDLVLLRQGMAHELRGAPTLALATYGKVSGPLHEAARLRAGVAAFAAGADARGDEALRALAAGTADPTLAATATLLRGSLWVEAGRPAEARAAFAALPAAHPSRAAAERLVADAARPLHLKSPGLAAGLSVVPALGQAYAKDPRSGRTLATWAALAAGTGLTGWWGTRAESPAALGVSGALGTGMVVVWGRGLWQAARAAEATNTAARAAERARLRAAAAQALPELPRVPAVP